MKEYFIVNIKGHQFEFSRITYSSFDIWYHIIAGLNKGEVVYRMNEVTEGIWKIKTPRMSPEVCGYELDCSEAIRKNESFN